MQQPDEAAPIAFVDTETTGLIRAVDEVWEFGGIRVDPDGAETPLHLYVEHDEGRCKALPEPFLTDHKKRWPPSDQVASRFEAGAVISQFLTNEGGPQVHIAGNTIDFDAWMIGKLLAAAGFEPMWSYHVIDIPSMARGYLLAEARWCRPDDAAYLRYAVAPPYKSEALSRLIGIAPPGEGDRHTAMGDARWARALYDRMERGR